MQGYSIAQKILGHMYASVLRWSCTAESPMRFGHSNAVRNRKKCPRCYSDVRLFLDDKECSTSHAMWHQICSYYMAWGLLAYSVPVCWKATNNPSTGQVWHLQHKQKGVWEPVV